MRKLIAPLVMALVVLVPIVAGVGAFLLVRPHAPWQPQISVYSDGASSRVGPYLSCDVRLRNCVVSEVVGELPVNERNPVQLQVDKSIARGPWRLIRWYADPAAAVATTYRPGGTFAVTIPTVDSQRGPLVGLAVQLLTLVRDPAGEVHEVEHAEWSVRTVWSSAPAPAAPTNP